MKKILCAVIILLKTSGITAQEILIPAWKDHCQVSGETHQLDNNGNVFVLGSVHYYDTFLNTVFNAGDYGNLLIKINAGGSVEWKNMYPADAGNKLLLKDDAQPVILFGAYSGMQPCAKSKTGLVPYRESTVNSAFLIDPQNGNCDRTVSFFSGKRCGTNRFEHCYKDRNGKFYIVYQNDSAWVNKHNAWHEQVIDEHLNVVSDEYLSVLNNSIDTDNYLSFISFDTSNANFIVGDRFGANIYNAQWQLQTSYAYKDLGLTFRGAQYSTAAFNKEYYAINAALSIKGRGVPDTAFTIILDKMGKIVSAQPSIQFKEMVLTEDNRLFGLYSAWEQYGPRADTIQKPLQLVEMDLYQNIKRRYSFGHQHLMSNHLSITQDNSFVITGTLSDTSINYPAGRNSIYYYKKPIDEIPLLLNANSLCSSVFFYPSPTRQFLNIVSNDFNYTHNATVEAFNMSGSKIFSRAFDTAKVVFDLSSVPAGVYMLKLTGDQQTCIQKFVKD